MKWRHLIEIGPLYYGLAFVNWVLLPHVYLNLMEVVLSSYRQPDLTKVVPAWNYIMIMVTFSYAAVVYYVRSRARNNVFETVVALFAAGWGCLVIPDFIRRVVESVGKDGKLDDMGLRMLLGGTVPALLCVFIAALALGNLLLKKLNSSVWNCD